MLFFLKPLRHAIPAAIAVLALCNAMLAQKSEDTKLQEEITSLKSDVQNLAAKQQQVLDQLAEIKKLLEKPTAAANPNVLQLPETINVEGNPSLGSASARVAIIEFTDFQCPFCGRFTEDAYPKIIADYVNTGKIRFLYRDLPLTSIHPWAQSAAVAAHCAGEQGKFWEMHNSLFTNQRSLKPPDIADRATKLGLDMTRFNECINSTRYNNAIEASTKSAQQMNISGTPTFLLGTFKDNGTIMKIEKSIIGAYPYEKFQADLDALLQKK
jgi:protein-disulfide isomerase